MANSSLEAFRLLRCLFGLGADIEASNGRNWIEDRGLEPTYAGHPRFGRKDEAEASWDGEARVLDGKIER